MRWNKNLYCTHPLHITQCGKPEHISKAMFKRKNCGNQDNGVCSWLTIEYNPPKAKKIIDCPKDIDETKHSLKMLVQEKDKKIKQLTIEVNSLLQKYNDLKGRYNKIYEYFDNGL